MPIYGKENTYKIFFSRTKKSVEIVQMMILGWPLFFLRQGQICISIQCFEKSFSQSVLKTNGWNLQYIIKVIKLLVTVNMLSSGVICQCLWAKYKYKTMLSLNVFFPDHFRQILHGLSVKRGTANLFKWVCTIWTRWPLCHFLKCSSPRKL